MRGLGRWLHADHKIQAWRFGVGEDTNTILRDHGNDLMDLNLYLVQWLLHNSSRLLQIWQGQG